MARGGGLAVPALLCGVLAAGCGAGPDPIVTLTRQIESGEYASLAFNCKTGVLSSRKHKYILTPGGPVPNTRLSERVVVDPAERAPYDALCRQTYGAAARSAPPGFGPEREP
ncbi:MAG TPA: hypothetical protein PKX87_02760 [Alphaproteobacteria bacterium]|nr:hypothetical protein [Alphaproteobacteria bacterium]